MRRPRTGYQGRTGARPSVRTGDIMAPRPAGVPESLARDWAADGRDPVTIGREHKALLDARARDGLRRARARKSKQGRVPDSGAPKGTDLTVRARLPREGRRKAPGGVVEPVHRCPGLYCPECHAKRRAERAERWREFEARLK